MSELENDDLNKELKTDEANAFDITKKFKKPQPVQQQYKNKKTQPLDITDSKTETKRLFIFLVLCFGISWATEIFGIIPMYQSGNEEVIREGASLVSQLMLTPALAALTARLITREGFAKSGLQFNFKEYKFLYLFGWFGATALIILGAALYFLVFRNNFDVNMTTFVTSLSETAAASGTQIDTAKLLASCKTDLLIKVFTAAVLDIINSFGEEWGFRAYLLPKLYRKFGAVPAMILSGFASGLWYAPLVMAGYYYGTGNAGFPIVNVAAMCIFGTVTGILYSFLCLRTGSIFPAVFAHSAVNVMLTQAVLLTYDGGNPFIGPSPTGILSGLPFIITAVLCIIYMYRHPIKKEE